MTMNWKWTFEKTNPKVTCEAQAAEIILKWYTQGKSSNQIRELLHTRISATGVLRFLRKWGAEIRSKGGDNYVKWLNFKIPRKDFDTLSYTAISEKYGMGRHTVFRITKHFREKGRKPRGSNKLI